MNIFKTLAMVGLVGVGMLSKGLCADSEDADLKMWQEKAAAIKQGTPLAEVKKIFGINPETKYKHDRFQVVFCSGPHHWITIHLRSKITLTISYHAGKEFSNDPVNQVSVRSESVITKGTIPAGSERLPNAFHGNGVEIEYAPVTEGDVMRKMLKLMDRPSPSPTPQ